MLLLIIAQLLVKPQRSGEDCVDVFLFFNQSRSPLIQHSACLDRMYVASVKWTLRSPLKPKRGFTCQRHASPLADVRLCCVLGSDVTHSSTVSRYVSTCACTLLDLPIKLCKSFFECLRGEAPTARDASPFNYSFTRSPRSQVSHRVFEDAAPL